ncbi:MAG: hypothetical protein RLZZ292_83, partial [Bacteroidota bacterium]
IKKTKSNPTSFEQYLVAQPRAYECEWENIHPSSEKTYYNNPIWDDFSEASLDYCAQFDTCKLLDYKGMYYFNRDDLENAYETWKRIPEDFWFRVTYRNNIINPFLQYGVKSSKTGYAKGLIELKKQIALPNTPKKGLLYTQLAKAYYESGIEGNAWYLREILRGSTSSNASYAGSTGFAYRKAQEYFLAAFALCKDKEAAGMLGKYITECHYFLDANAYYTDHSGYSYNNKRKDWSFYPMWKQKFNGTADDYNNYAHNCGLEMQHW